MVNDPIADMMTRIRNATRVTLPAVEVPHSKMKESIAKILKTEGYVSDVAVEVSKRPPPRMKIGLILYLWQIPTIRSCVSQIAAGCTG